MCGTQRQTLSRSYGRCIAEFLKKGSLVHLGLLDPSTGVGLRYGRLCLLIPLLFWSAWLTRISRLKPFIRVSPPAHYTPIGICHYRDHLVKCTVQGTHCLDEYSQKFALVTTPRHMGEQHCRYGNINPLSIAYATRLGLGPTNPGTIIVAQETLLLRWAGFSPALKLLIPAFSLSRAPPDFPV